jgi:hypothetical protein
LQQIGAAKTELEARAQARYELEKVVYDAKQAQRQEREQQLGHKLGGRAPKPQKLSFEGVPERQAVGSANARHSGTWQRA